MIKYKKKLILLWSILFLSLFTLVGSQTPFVQSSNSSTNQCGNLIVLNGNVTLPFPLTDVFAVYNHSEFNWTADWRAQPNAANYYNTTTGSNYYNLTMGGSVITGISLPDGTWVVVVVMDDMNPNNIAVDNTCPPDNQCGPILVQNGNITLPFPLTAVYGVYNRTEFDYNADWRNQPGITNYYTGGSNYYNLSMGQSVITGIGLPDGTWVVVVVENDKSTMNIALETTCPPDNGRLPFKTITWGVHEGDVYNYSVSIKFDGAYGDHPIPFFGLQTASGTEFTVQNDHNLVVKVINVMGLDSAGNLANTKTANLNQAPNNGPGFGLNVTLSSAGNMTNIVDGTVLALPLEFLEYFVENGTDIMQGGGGGGPQFWDLVSSHTDTTVTTRSADNMFTITYDRTTGLFTQLTMSGQPEPGSPFIDLSINFVSGGSTGTDTSGTSGTSSVSDSTGISDTTSNTDTSGSSETSGTNVISPTPGFEFVFLLLGFVSLVIIRKKN